MMRNGKVPHGPIVLPGLSGKQVLTVLAALLTYEHLQRNEPGVIEGICTGKGWSDVQLESLLSPAQASALMTDMMAGGKRGSGRHGVVYGINEEER